MSDVTGPISTLPGASHFLPTGAVCDTHPMRPAVSRIQGETDSHGSELIDMCQQCVNEHRTWKKVNPGRCDWCKCEVDNLHKHRDFEEGSSGRVYDVCSACIKKENKALQEELNQLDDDNEHLWADDD